MREKRSGRDKIEGRKQSSAVARGVVICVVAAVIGFSAISIPVLAGPSAAAAVQTVVGESETVEVKVNAPEYVESTFTATIDVDNVTDLNSGSFRLSFNASVVNVTGVRDGEIGGETIPIYMWAFDDADTVTVLVNMGMDVGVSGSGHLAELEFEVKGKSGDKSVLDIRPILGTDVVLVDTEGKEIPVELVDDEVTVLRTVVSVDAPEYVAEKEKFNAAIRIEDATDLNSGQFNLSFDASVVNVTDLRDGEIDGEAVPIIWNFLDAGMVRVVVSMPIGEGVSGSGCLAEVEFEVKGESGEKSKLDISDGLLVNTEAEEIETEWYDDEVRVPWTTVAVDASENVPETFNALIRVDNVTDLNAAQFDLSFDKSVLEVTGVEDGEIDGETVPVFMWRLNPDKDTVRVVVALQPGESVSGSGSLAEIEFEVKGKSGETSELDISNGLLADAEAREIVANWHDDEVTVEHEMPSVIIRTDKAVYEPGETQKISLTVENPLTRAVQVNLGMSFHAFEIAGEPCSYEWEFLETGLIWLPAESVDVFELPVEGLVLPEGKYAWSANLENAVGMEISESVARFSVAAGEAEAVEAVPSVAASVNANKAVFEEFGETVKGVVSAELS